MYQVVGIGDRRTGTGKNGKPYDFTEIYCTYEDEEVTGLKAEAVMFHHRPKRILPDIAVGDTVHVFYDKDGFLRKIEKSGGKAPMPKL